jgi:hypothetical protein
LSAIFSEKFQKHFRKSPEKFPLDVDVEVDVEVEKSSASKTDAAIERVARNIHERHPAVRRCGLAEVKKSLKAIVSKLPASTRILKLEAIDRNHASKCQSSDWTKDGGQFAQGLANWLRPTLGRFDEPAPNTAGSSSSSNGAARKAPADDGPRPVEEMSGEELERMGYTLESYDALNPKGSPA